MKIELSLAELKLINDALEYFAIELEKQRSDNRKVLEVKSKIAKENDNESH